MRAITVNESLNEESENIDIHNNIVKGISNISGVEDVKELFENPNKYNSIVSHISFKYDIEDKDNYNKGSFNLDYKRKVLFIPDKGYIPLESIDPENIISIIKKNYNLK